MKHTIRNLCVVLLLVLTGCQTYAPSNFVRTVTINGAFDRKQVCNAVIEAARDVNLPAMTKLDMANGVVEFGSFEAPELGLTAQVRIVSDSSMEITVRRGSILIPLKANAQADAFRNKNTERLTALGKAAS